MPETTPFSRPAEPYFAGSSLHPGVGSTPGSRAMATITTSPDVEQASDLLLKGRQLLQESRAAEAEPLLLRALELYERQGNVSAECLRVHCELASIATTRADLAAAESHLQRALTLANACLTADDPDVATILAGGARVYLRRRAFTKAEPLLQRLLEIKCARGEEHAEVATVLASLATVHSAMGAHESAERMLRRVLSIREKTLSPHHFATVTALEHLADSCAARGNFEEGIALLHRALAHRQCALGSSHPSIAVARARIADLELLSSNEEVAAAEASAATLGTLPEIETPSGEPVYWNEPPPTEAIEGREPSPREMTHPLYDEWEDEFDEAQPKRPVLGQLGSRAASVTAFARTPRGRVTVLAVGVTSLLAAIALGVRTRADGVEVAANEFAVASRSAPTGLPPADKAAAPEPSFTAQPSTTPARPPVARSGELLRPPTPPMSRSSVRSAPVEPADEESELIPLPTAQGLRAFETPLAATTIAPLPGPVVAVDFALSPASSPPPGLSSRAIASPGAAFVHAALPAGNPAPEYPPELLHRRVEGRVVAEFLVDAKGRADARTLRIISSTDEQFTQAVRAVLPKLRFLPAETDGTKAEEWVAMPFRFSLKPQ
jgi:TonB family protein